MADTKISALTAATSLSDTDAMVLASSGASKKITGANLKASMSSALLSTTTLGSDGTFDVSGISQSYNDLILVLIARDAAGTTNNDIQLLFNADTGNHYAWVRSTTSNTTNAATSNGATLSTRLEAGRIPASTAVANAFGAVTIQIAGYASTTWLKTVQFDAASYDTTSSSGIQRQIGAGVWNQTTAITRVQLAVVSGTNFATGSQLRIYGRL